MNHIFDWSLNGQEVKMKGNKTLDSIAHAMAPDSFQAAKILKEVSHTVSKLSDEDLLESLIFGIEEIRRAAAAYKITDLKKECVGGSLPEEVGGLLCTVASLQTEAEARFNIAGAKQ